MGLPFLVTCTALGGTVTLYCGNGGVAEIDQLLDTFLGPPLFPAPPETRTAITPKPFGLNGRLHAGGTTVEAVPAHHPGGAAILLISDASGPQLAYAPDNELAEFDQSPERSRWRQALAARLRGVSVLLHDAHWQTDEAARHAGWGHSSAIEATHFALACGAGRLLLAHHHPDRSDAAVSQMLDECRAVVQQDGASLVVDVAREGLTLRLPESP